jgi:hypothetical protein
MNPYAKFGWFLYALFALFVFIPVWWSINVKLSTVLSGLPASAVGFAAAAIFLGLPFIVFGVRMMLRDSRKQAGSKE